MRFGVEPILMYMQAFASQHCTGPRSSSPILFHYWAGHDLLVIDGLVWGVPGISTSPNELINIHVHCK